MWFPGETWQCPGCTGFTSQFTRLEFLEAYDARFVIVTQGPIDEALAQKPRRKQDDLVLHREQPLRHRRRRTPGGGFAVNVFLRDGDTVYRTWHTNGRGTEQLSHSFALIDLLPTAARRNGRTPQGLAPIPHLHPLARLQNNRHPLRPHLTKATDTDQSRDCPAPPRPRYLRTRPLMEKGVTPLSNIFITDDATQRLKNRRHSQDRRPCSAATDHGLRHGGPSAPVARGRPAAWHAHVSPPELPICRRPAFRASRPGPGRSPIGTSADGKLGHPQPPTTVTGAE